MKLEEFKELKNVNVKENVVSFNINDYSFFDDHICNDVNCFGVGVVENNNIVYLSSGRSKEIAELFTSSPLYQNPNVYFVSVKDNEISLAKYKDGEFIEADAFGEADASGIVSSLITLVMNRRLNNYTDYKLNDLNIKFENNIITIK